MVACHRHQPLLLRGSHALRRCLLRRLLSRAAGHLLFEPRPPPLAPSAHFATLVVAKRRQGGGEGVWSLAIAINRYFFAAARRFAGVFFAAFLRGMPAICS